MNLKIKICVLMALGLWLHGSIYADIPVEDSVVKIVNQYNRFSWYTPWASGGTGKGTGSGFVISKKRILTNAHVVSDSALLLVYFHNDPKPYPAQIVAIGHDCDLAILELKDPKRVADVPELEFDELPSLRSQVTTYGYPIGGKLLSSTVGVVSRIEMQMYAHSGLDTHLAVQTDAAINPGNSGGPVIQNNKVVGVAFQGNRKLENMGFFIPVPVIKHFLDDLEDEQYDGFPEFGMLCAAMENPAARHYAGMKAEETGIRVDFILRGSSAENILEMDDILTSINEYKIANDGTVEWNGMRLNNAIILEEKQMGDTLRVEIIRNHKRMKLNVGINHYNPSSSKANLYNIRPKYYIYAGLVFVPFNRATLATYSDNWYTDAPQELIHEMYYRYLEEDDVFDAPQVMIIRHLDHVVNAEETKWRYSLIESINDKTVRTLAEVVDAFENHTADQHVIRFQHYNRITVIDRNKADAAHEEILQQYAIPKDRCL